MRLTGKNVTIQDNSIISSTQTGTEKSGNINIKANNLLIWGGANVSASTSSTGNGGNLNIDAQDVQVSGTGNNDNIPSGLKISVEKGSTGNGGDLNITTNNLLVEGGAFISNNTYGEGNGGDMTINATSKVKIIGQGGNKNQYPSGLFVVGETPSTGNSGSLIINTKLMIVRDDGFLNVGNNSLGSAGGMKITTNDLLIQNNARVFVGRKMEGKNVGELTIKTNNLLVEGGATVQAGTSGKTGNLNIDALDVQVIGTSKNGNTPSQLIVETKKSSPGNAGSLTINTKRIRVVDGAFLSTGTSGKGARRDLKINAEDVQIIGKGGNNPQKENQPYPSGLFTSSETNSTSDAGKLTINTKRMVVQDGALVSSSTKSKGNGGDLTINTNTLLIVDGAKVNTGTSGVGNGGNLTVNALDIKLIGTGNNSNIKSELSASASQKSKRVGIAGNLFLNSAKITLDNQAKLSAESTSGNGGNINLKVGDLLLLRRGSEITTNAGTFQQGGDGGNININSKFIVALPKENSNITANAFTGKGGRVNIKTKGIFGIVPQLSSTDFSDITASLQLGVNGEISIDNPDINPSKGLEELPADVVNAAGLINQNLCTAARRGSEFVITGRGGLPASPHNIGDAFLPWEDWSISGEGEISKSKPVRRNNQSPQKSEQVSSIVEAQGWIVDSNGDIIFTAFPAKVNKNSTWLHPNDCQRLRAS